ncbi:MAG: prepilin-type N-terminal cleavage/methylation domain-containing protein [Planctomycetia bacterium]|nr:prepilin-type N-terminal cleavage/methylation domain-containing protein [Planctomycetia bacterium]
MNKISRDVNHDRRCSSWVRRARNGFTLLEVVVALTITLILMGLVVEIFSKIGKGVNNSRANMELNDQLRNAKHRLIQDLRGVTAPMTPPLSPYMNHGYFEYVEGPRCASTQTYAGSSGGDIGEELGTVGTNAHYVNSVIGDSDDILMFTTRSVDDELFIGRGGAKNGLGIAATSRYAEVAWFLRRVGSEFVVSKTNDVHPEFFNLHRRAWLIVPGGTPYGGTTYDQVDLSMRPSGGNFDSTDMPPNSNMITNNYKDARKIAPSALNNSLGDLTRRECRSLHQPYIWPYEMMYVPNLDASKNFLINTSYQAWGRYAHLSLPTMAEQSNGTFPGPAMEKSSPTSTGVVYVPKNFVTANAAPVGIAFPGAMTTTNVHSQLSAGTRIGEDIILTNVVSFDVKAWDPGAPVFSGLPPTNSDTSNVITSLLVPGDGGYPGAVDKFNGNASNTIYQPVAFGAYADLNYMGTDASYSSPDFLAVDRYNKYCVNSGNALRTMETGSSFSGRLPRPHYAHPGEGALAGLPKVIALAAAADSSLPRPCVYDTWSTHYDFDGLDNDGDGSIDELTNGADDNLNGLIDEPNVYSNGTLSGEQDAPPPYRSSLRGIKITIRVMEQESKQVREVTIVQEFIPL